jgi:hypothetical protein
MSVVISDSFQKRVAELGTYPKDWQLTHSELDNIVKDCEAGLSTTNGDTAPVTLTVRQVLLLLKNQPSV